MKLSVELTFLKSLSAILNDVSSMSMDLSAFKSSLMLFISTLSSYWPIICLTSPLPAIAGPSTIIKIILLYNEFYNY